MVPKNRGTFLKETVPNFPKTFNHFRELGTSKPMYVSSDNLKIDIKLKKSYKNAGD